jgi:hypothetical protein
MDEHNELDLGMDLVLLVEHIVMEKQQQHYMVEQFVDLAYDLAYSVVDKHQPKTRVVPDYLSEDQDIDDSSIIYRLKIFIFLISSVFFYSKKKPFHHVNKVFFFFSLALSSSLKYKRLHVQHKKKPG